MQNTKTKYKNTEIGLIPEDWEVKKLGDCAFVTKLAGFEYSLHFNSYKDQGEIIVVRGTNITHNKLDLNDVKTIPRKTSNNLQRSKLNKNDLVFAYVGTIGPIFLVEEDDRFHLGPNTSKITVNREHDSKYLFHFFTSTFLKKEIIEHTSIGAQPSLSMFKIRSFKILTPHSLTEQKAIATALSDTDALISSLEQLISKKRAIKQGTMQQLLKPKDGWEVKKLGDVAEFSSGVAHENHVSSLGKYTLVNSKFISTEANIKKFTNYPLCPARKNDILIVLSDVPNGRAIAKCFLVKHDNKYTVNQRIGIIRTNQINTHFLYLIINRNPYFLSFDDGAKQTNLRNQDVLNFEFASPKSLNEQAFISTILSDMDTEIQNLEIKLHKYKQIKQGMMQQLLTGKIRLV